MAMNPLKLLRCPNCAAKLISGTPQRYETLVEHVTDPNGTSPVRGTLICSYHRCATRAAGVFWAPDGEGPYDGTGKGIRWIDGNSSPIGSYHQDH